MTDTDYKVPERYRRARVASSQRQTDLEDMLSPGQLLDQATGAKSDDQGMTGTRASTGSRGVSPNHFIDALAKEAGKRPEGHGVGTPPAVAEAWEAVQKALAGYSDAVTARRAIDKQEKEAQAKEAARVRQEVAAGKDAKPAVKGTDFDALRRHADAVARGHFDRVDAARAAYDAEVAKALPAWSAAVLAEVVKAHAKARGAVASASAATEHLTSVVEAAQALGCAADPQARASLPWDKHKAVGGLEAAAAELERETWRRVEQGSVVDRPVGVGTDLLTYGQRATIAGRVQWDTGAHALAEWQALLKREEREGYRFTRQGRPVEKSA